MDSKKNAVRISPSTGLSLFKECQRCFWLHYNERVHRPRGIFPSLPGGMDLVIKKYYDNFRGSLPPELKGKVDGVLMPDIELMNKWRNWRTGLQYYDEESNAVLFGALDECLMDNGIYMPLDYKTRGSEPKEGDSERYYQTQLDAYNLLLSANGYKVKGHSYLVYYFPKEVKEKGRVEFEIRPVKINTDPERAKQLLKDAVLVLESPPPPKHSGCEYCLWLGNRLEFE